MNSTDRLSRSGRDVIRIVAKPGQKRVEMGRAEILECCKGFSADPWIDIGERADETFCGFVGSVASNRPSARASQEGWLLSILEKEAQELEGPLCPSSSRCC